MMALNVSVEFYSIKVSLLLTSSCLIMQYDCSCLLAYHNYGHLAICIYIYATSELTSYPQGLLTLMIADIKSDYGNI